MPIGRRPRRLTLTRAPRIAEHSCTCGTHVTTFKILASCHRPESTSYSAGLGKTDLYIGTKLYNGAWLLGTAIADLPVRIGFHPRSQRRISMAQEENSGSLTWFL